MTYAYMRRKRFEARLIAAELAQLIGGGGEQGKIKPSAMMAKLGIRL